MDQTDDHEIQCFEFGKPRDEYGSLMNDILESFDCKIR